MMNAMEKKPQQSESRDADKYVVRFPDGMRDRIAEVAKANNRSMNAEIIARLQESLDAPATAPEHVELKLAQLLEENIGVRVLLAKQLELMAKLASGKFADDAEHPKPTKSKK